MFCPSTPTLKRKLSSKKILISSPSQEIIHFLTLPNPAATEDPRQRLRIVTPKKQLRSVSTSLEHSPKTVTVKKKPSGLSRVSLMRKKVPVVNWTKKNLDVRSGKLSLSDNYKKESGSWKEKMTVNSSCRLDITFGVDRFQNCLHV